MKSFVLTLQRFAALRGMCAGIGIGVAALLFSAPSHALTFNYSFGDTAGTVSGRIVLNAANTQAIDLYIDTSPAIFGLTAGYDVLANCTDCYGNSFTVVAGLITAANFGARFNSGLDIQLNTELNRMELDQQVMPGYTVLDSNGSHSNFSPAVATTPLPAALPLFATGLGALGLLGWRRKRKAQATA
jgi:hypothetical protein